MYTRKHVERNHRDGPAGHKNYNLIHYIMIYDIPLQQYKRMLFVVLF